MLSQCVGLSLSLSLSLSLFYIRTKAQEQLLESSGGSAVSSGDGASGAPAATDGEGAPFELAR